MKVSSAASAQNFLRTDNAKRDNGIPTVAGATSVAGEEGVLSRVRQAQLAIDPTLPLEDVLHQIVVQGVALAFAQSGAVWVPREASQSEPREAAQDKNSQQAAVENAAADTETARNGASQTDSPLETQYEASSTQENLTDATCNGVTETESDEESTSWLCYALPEKAFDLPDAAAERASGEGASTGTARLAPALLDELTKAAVRDGQVQKTISRNTSVPNVGESLSAAPPHEYSCTADIAFPLESQGRIVGILQLRTQIKAPEADAPEAEESADAAFDSACQSQLALFCEHAAGAIDQARIFQQLRNAKREWEVTFDGMLDGVCVERSDGTILRANRALASLLDLDLGQILGEQRPELLARLPNYRLLKPLQRGAQDVSGLNVRNGEFRFGVPERIIAETVFSLRFLERRGRTRESRSRKPRLDEADHGHMVCVLRDVTEQRRLQEHLLQSEKLAALGELVSGVAHELNNPLTTVVGYAQLLQDDPALSENVRRQMGVIHSEAARAARIVSNLLAFARREEPRKNRLEINEALRPVVQMRAYQLQSQNTQLVAEYGTDLPPVWGDAHQLQQVLLNIINNAHQAMNAWRGSGEIRLTTQAVLVNGAAGVRISVSDNGPGIAPDHLRRLFDPFFTTKPMGEGTGLGMSISLGIVSNHEGRIWVESTLGHGALFVVELPAVNANDETETETDEYEADETAYAPTPRVLSAFEPNSAAQNDAPLVAVQPAAAQPAALEDLAARILVIDDEEPVVTLITEVLNLDGHEVTPAFNGAEALALLQLNDYDLILSDVRMPAVGGPTFFESLQTTRPDLLPHVVFVTGDTVSPSTREFLKKANRPMLAKPFDPERLRALVNEQLAANK